MWPRPSSGIVTGIGVNSATGVTIGQVACEVLFIETAAPRRGDLGNARLAEAAKGLRGPPVVGKVTAHGTGRRTLYTKGRQGNRASRKYRRSPTYTLHLCGRVPPEPDDDYGEISPAGSR